MAKTYAEKLKDPRWQKKRLEIMERDKFRCQCCISKEKTLHVHHLTYGKGKQPWDYPDSNFVTLCEECHEEAESNKTEILSLMGMRGLSRTIVSLGKLASEGNSHLSIASHLLYDVAMDRDRFLEAMKNPEDPDESFEWKRSMKERMFDLIACLGRASDKADQIFQEGLPDENT